VTEPAQLRVARALIARLVRARSALAPVRLPTNDRDVPIDPDVFAFLALMKRVNEFHPSAALGRMRRDYDTMGVALDLPRRELGHVEDISVDLPGRSLLARFYLPRERRQNGPGLVWLHGGGWVIGSLASHDHALRELSHRSGVPVLALDYRLGPEHRFPAAHDDALEGFLELRSRAARFGIDPSRLALGGDSAGGNLTISTALALKERREPMPAMLVPVYPAVEMVHRAPSRISNGSGYFLTVELMDWFADRYARGLPDRESVRMSVLRAPSFAGLPPTFLTTAGFDPLRDEGEQIARRMKADGVTIEHRSEDRLVHGYFTMGGIVPEAQRAHAAIANAVRSTLG
jgi:acetyl esterase